MTFLAPWAMALGVAGAVGVVLLHLVARRRPATYLLPTARFIPDQQSVVSRAAARPRDLLLLLLRALLLLLAGAAFARPVLITSAHGRARIVLLDQSALVADPADAARRADALRREATPSVLIAFDSTTRGVEQTPAPDAPRARAGSTTAALVAARRAAGALATRADSVELAIVSPIAASEIDTATWLVRARWPGAIRIDRLASRTDSAGPAALERALPVTDVLGPALARMPLSSNARAVRVRRDADVSAADSAFARAGGAVVSWDSAAAPLRASGLAVGDDVIVAPLGRRALLGAGNVVARWADGAPAARELTLGAGCVRTVGISAPSAGDLALRPAFQRIVRGLVAPCARASLEPADSADVARLVGRGGAATSSALASDERAPSRLVPWLLGAALLCGLLELGLRRTVREVPS